MRTLLLILTLATLLGCGSAADDPIVIVIDPEQPTTEAPAEPTGAELYALNCESCHGPEALGAPTWTGSIRGLDDIEPIVRDGRGTMAAVDLTASEIAKIQTYLDDFGVNRSSLSGRDIFENRCAPCHGARGVGTALGFPIQFMPRGFGEWVVRNGRETQRFPGPMPAYSPDEISPEQLTEIADFMWAQPIPGGGEALYGSFCQNCHGENGRGGYAGHLVAQHDPTAIVRAGHGGSAYDMRSRYMPSWSTTELSDAQLAAIKSYLLAL